MQRLTARWIIPVDQPPLEWGVIEIEGDRIVAVSPAPAAIPADVTNLGECAVLPGLVNAHTHLEFSDLRQPIAACNSFADWIDRVVAHRRAAPTHNEAVRRGYEESLISGVTTIGEIATTDDWRQLPESKAVGVTFREILGLKPDRRQRAIELAQAHLDQHDLSSPASWIRGLSPHAPYSVHPVLYEQLIELAVAAGAPVAVHLAETTEELEFLTHGRGPLIEQLEKFGAWERGLIPKGTRVLDYLIPLADADRGLVIHGNYLSDEEIAFLASRPNLSVVYCPRTHAAFGHPPHPWLKLIESGIRVALGTDSRASNPDLSLWNEVRFLKERFPNVKAELLIRLATLNGAEALGCESNVGSLTEGKLANLVILKPNESFTDLGAAEDFVLSTQSVTGVMQSGRWIH